MNGDERLVGEQRLLTQRGPFAVLWVASHPVPVSCDTVETQEEHYYY